MKISCGGLLWLAKAYRQRSSSPGSSLYTGMATVTCSRSSCRRAVVDTVAGWSNQDRIQLTALKPTFGAAQRARTNDCQPRCQAIQPERKRLDRSRPRACFRLNLTRGISYRRFRAPGVTSRDATTLERPRRTLLSLSPTRPRRSLCPPGEIGSLTVSSRVTGDTGPRCLDGA